MRQKPQRGMLILTGIATAGLLAVAAVPAEAKSETSSCRPFRAGSLNDGGLEKTDASNAPLVKLRDRHTKSDPLEIRFEIGPIVWAGVHPIIDDTVVYNVQVYTRRPRVDLNARIEWQNELLDLDLGVYDSRGENLAWSGSFNNPVLDAAYSAVYGPVPGGPGFEEARDIAARPCAGFSVMTWSMFAPQPEPVVLKLWLGRRTPR